MMVIIIHAVGDEHGNSHGGKAGDQTGREVRIQDWYLREAGWSCAIRAKASSVAEKIAASAEAIANNPYVGYDQYERTTMWELAKGLKWRFEKIKTPCETDCSNMVSACVNAAGIKLSKDVYTGNLAEALIKTEAFDIYTSKRYRDKPFWLRRGDILLGTGHVCIVISNGAVITQKLKKGMKGAEVKVLQEALTDLGYPCGTIDGEYGSKTEAAVENFQRAHMLKVTGNANKNTCKTMGVVWKG